VHPGTAGDPHEYDLRPSPEKWTFARRQNRICSVENRVQRRSADGKGADHERASIMNGLGGLNKSPNGVVIGLVQLQLPNVVTRSDLAKQTERIVWMVGKARRNLSTMDLVVFPEYSLHGLSMDTNPEIMPARRA
jgi:hypothetical protein